MLKYIFLYMLKQFIKEAFGWGLALWIFGYALSLMLFQLVSFSVIGWIITPIATAVTILVLVKKIKGDSIKYYLALGVVWSIIAIIFDYFFIVKAFNPADGYYKFDIFLYYALAFTLPLIVGWKKLKTSNTAIS